MEDTLRRLAKALRTCFKNSDDKAEKIVTLTYDDFLYADPPWKYDDGDDVQEAEKRAEYGFMEELDRAHSALTWRALVSAHRAGRAMRDYAFIHDGFGDPWMDWRRQPSGDPPAQFVKTLSDEDFLVLRVACHVYGALNLQDSPAIPTDGDLDAIPPYLETAEARTWPQWFEVMGEPPTGVRWHYLLRLAGIAARRDLAGDGAVRPSGISKSISDLTDKVDSVTAVQMPILDAVERMEKALGTIAAQDRFKIEGELRGVLGSNVYSSLCDEARTALLDAERRFKDQGVLDWNSVVANIGKAFELQLRGRLLPALAEHLKTRKVWCFPDGDTLTGGKPVPSIIKGGKVVPTATLGMISMALGRNSQLLDDYAQLAKLDIRALRRCIDSVTPYRNIGAHGSGMTDAEALRLREKWLGIGRNDGGIFGAVCPRSSLRIE